MCGNVAQKKPGICDAIQEQVSTLTYLGWNTSYQGKIFFCEHQPY
jgi:hypothetical protein